MIASLVIAAVAGAAMPPAGARIGNEAAARYTDTSGKEQNVTSGTVTTVVLQVPGLNLTTDLQDEVVSPGGTFYFPHTLQNTGNGTDTYALVATPAVTGSLTFSALVMYADADQNGAPDNATPISSTGELAAGGSFHFVVAASVPGDAAAPQTRNLTVEATSGTYSGATATMTNTDTLTVSGYAVVIMTKATSSPSGPSPSTAPFTYTLSFTNTGNSPAVDFGIWDVIPAGLVYVPGSGRWSVTNPTALTDDVADAQPDPGSPHIYYAYNGTTKEISAMIDVLGAGQSGTLSFQVEVQEGLPPQTIDNRATFAYYDGDTDRASATNTVRYTVLQTASVDVTDYYSVSAQSTTDADGANDKVRINTATQGASVPFDVVVHNGGSGEDAFNITLSGSGFPSGTTFILYKSDGVTPLVDTTSDGIPDTGPIAGGGDYHVFVVAVLPPLATGGGAYDVTVRGTSNFDGAIWDEAIAELGTITASTVDMTNDLAGAGAGAGPEDDPVTTNNVDRGSSTTFALYINNTSAVADSYDLAGSTDPTFASITLPSGWTLVFKESATGVCTTTGAVITGTGIVNAAASRLVCAVVSVPASALYGTTQLYFRARSQNTGAADRKHDAVAVNALRSITVTPDNPGQVASPGSVIYEHFITNHGNVTEGEIAVGGVLNGSNSIVALTIVNGWASATVWWDKDNDGLDADDPQITDLSQLVGGSNGSSTAAGLAPGESARLWVKVIAPSGLDSGVQDIATLTATTTGTIGVAAPPASSAKDTSTVIKGQVRIVKLQALDDDCSGTDGLVYSNVVVNALPGACIRYEITATNDGSGDITDLVVSDATPTSTVYDNGSRDSRGGDCGTGAADAPAYTDTGSIGAAPAPPSCGGTGTIQAEIGTLTPGQKAVFTFGVMVNN